MSRKYTIELIRTAKCDLKKLDKEVGHRIAVALDDLGQQEDPYWQVKKLEGASESTFYALRVGE